jgi:two-component system, NtrC family, response regulator HydG
VAVVLIVEDDTQVRMLAEAVLRGAGDDTRSASTPAEAQALLGADQAFDVLFTDISLFDEREAGLDLAQAAGARRPDLPVLYATARGITGHMLKRFVRCNAFIAKPYTREQLLTALANVLKQAAPRDC